MQTQDEVVSSERRTGMARQSLRVTVLLGMLITVVGGTGIFAAFTDRATTGTNSVETGTRPSAVDIRIGDAIIDGDMAVTCDVNQAFSDDLATGIFSFGSLQPGTFSSSRRGWSLCLQNAGSASLDIEATVIDLVDTDTSCTGQEAEAGDATCGGGELGELSGSITVQMQQVECGSNIDLGVTLAEDRLAAWPANPVALSQPLGPNEVACVALWIWLPSSTPEETIQVTQSDKVEWRFAFDATLTP